MFRGTHLRRLAIAAAGSAAILLGGPAAAAGLSKLTLINGWKTYRGSAKPTLLSYQGIVHLRGAIWTRTTASEPFVIPALFRPAAQVIVKVDLCDDANGQIVINPDGSTQIQSEGNFAAAQCFTSLDGATYAVDASGSTALNLQNSWVPYGNGTAAPAAHALGNVVHLEGAMMNGATGAAFVMPENMRPQFRAYVPLNMGNVTSGEIVINTDGTVDVQSASDFGLAQILTSLDGASYSLNSAGFTPLGLLAGWTGTSDTLEPAARLDHGVVQLQGAMKTVGTTDELFILPDGMKPKMTVVVPVVLCNAANGRLEINPDGSVFVQAENDIASAYCMTSLEGVSFHL